jgi:hypothetical protein
MFKSDLSLTAARVANLSADCDKLCTHATRESEPMEVTQALLAASWSLRVAYFALKLASKHNESNGTLGPSPSSRSATGG